MQKLITGTVLCLALGLPGLGPALAEDEFGDFVVAPGAEETYYACIACHSEKIVVQQGLTRKDWDELLDWMIEEQGMYEPEAEERRIILDYLATHYGTDRPNFPAH